MADETIIMGDGETVVGSDEPQRSSLLSLRPEPLDFEANDGQYFTLMCGDIVGEGGEGCVVRALDDAGKEYVAKIAYIIPAEQANTETILQLLYERTQADPHACHRDHLMPIYAWGTIRAQPLGSARETELMVTIMPRCTPLEGGALSPSYVKTVVLPQLACAIQTLHDLNIVHRDVKPANVYVNADKSIVLGDFGISTMLGGGESVRNTRLSRRTPGYTPHVHFVVQENDWYALGYTLWTLYNGGVHPHQRFLEEEMRSHESATLAKVMIGERPVSFKPRSADDETFGQLIYGLTTVDVKRRLGYEDIQRYLADPAGFSYHDAAPASAAKEVDYSFEGTTCHNKLELAYALSQKWERAKRHLYAGNVSNYLSMHGDQDLSTIMYEIVEEDDDTISNQDLGLAKAIWLLSGDQHLLYWKGGDVSFPTLVGAFGSHEVDELSRFDEALASGVLSWSLARLHEGSFEELPLIREIEAAAQTQPRFSRCLFKQLFTSTDTASAQGESGLEAQMRLLFASPRAVYELVEDEAALDEKLASIAPAAASLGTLSRLVNGRAELAKKQDATVLLRVEILLVLLDSLGNADSNADSNADKSSVVRSFTLKYGPKSAWLWAAAHAYLYKGADQKAEAAIRKLETVKVSESSSVISIMKASDLARHLFQDIVRDLPPTPLNVYLGYKYKTHIECGDLDGFFCASLYGDVVPRGFARQLLLDTPEAERASWTDVKLLSDACRENAAKQGGLTSTLALSLNDCKSAVFAVGSKNESLIEIVISIALLVLVCAFQTRRDFVGMVTDGFTHTLAIGHTSLPEKAGLAVQVVAWSAFVFSAVNFLVSFLSYRWSAGAEKMVDKCQAMLDRAQVEKDGFASGKSDLAKKIMDPNASGALKSLDLYRDAAELVKETEAHAALNSKSWYSLVWQVSSFITALGPVLYFGAEWVITFHVTINQLLVQIGTFFKLDNVPAVNLGSLVYLITVAAAFLFGYMTALGRLGSRKRNALLWLRLVVLSIVWMLVALVAAALILIAMSALFAVVVALFTAFVAFAPQHPMVAMAIVIGVAVVVRIIISLLGRR